MWHQRSRVEWLKAGDLNTSYFHSRATQRNRRNFISKLTCEDGGVVKDEQKIGEMMAFYFSDFKTTTAPSNFEPILQGIERKVTPQMNLELTREYTTSEVEATLKQMKSISALGPDGMPPIFFKHFWNIVGPDVLSATLSVLNLGTIPPKINHTFESLIPKTKSLKIAKDFQPISLCNVIYKLISKTIANRLKKCLPKLVSESQSTFPSNCLITDNILVAFETLHHLKNKRTGKTSSMALKLDMSKAYDRVEWTFLENLMDKLGFDREWTDLIKSCISIVSLSILINGAPYGLIHLQRSLR